MSFVAQFASRDVPGCLDDGRLISFHYCEECRADGRMSFGHNDRENRGYAVDLLDTGMGLADDLGVVAPSSIPSLQLAFSDVVEVPGFEDLVALGIYDDLPANFFDEDLADLDDATGSGFTHVERSKVGGWPHWQQTPEWPTCSEGRRMSFLLQIDYEIGQDAAWGGGGYAYLFACGRDCEHPEADLVIQTT